MAKNDEKIGIVHIYSTFNNTLVKVTDLAGNTIGSISGGQVTKHNRLKANPTIGMFISKRIKEMVKDYGITSFYVRMRGQSGSTGTGPGANAVARTLVKEGLKVISISDITRIPRGGPKKKGGRRGRRV